MKLLKFTTELCCDIIAHRHEFKQENETFNKAR